MTQIYKVDCEVFRVGDGLYFKFPGLNYSFNTWSYLNGICGGPVGEGDDHNARDVTTSILNRLEWRNMVGVE